ncbi:MAG: type II 3-dehydroquinate dehydratase [Alphaproteobacteria bacterium]
MPAAPLFILNGPNLNLLGTREPEIYGSDTLKDIESSCRHAADGHGVPVVFRQTNHEGVLIDWVQEAGSSASGLILNAGAFTHTSIALLDALKTLSIPIIELHLSNPAKRETFRHISYVAPAATGLICGFGARGYVLAVDAITGLIAPPPGKTSGARVSRNNRASDV